MKHNVYLKMNKIEKIYRGGGGRLTDFNEMKLDHILECEISLAMLGNRSGIHMHCLDTVLKKNLY